MMSVPSDAELRAHIRARLAEGTLPSRQQSQKIYASYGDGQPCDCCGRSIGSTDVLYEIEVPSDCVKSLAMHLPCFEIWVGELRAAASARLRVDRDKAAA
jgi:hypothetical protein